MSLPSMKDSGARRQFATGAVRDTVTDKPMPELISPIAMERLGAWLARGAKKYSARNWEKGMPLSSILGSAFRHMLKIMMRRRDEDHEAAFLCNAMFLLHTSDQIRKGLLPKELDDLPRYRRTRLCKKRTK